MTVTRFGRSVKKQVIYVPVEEVRVDDYAPEEHDSAIDSDIDNEEAEGLRTPED